MTYVAATLAGLVSVIIFESLWEQPGWGPGAAILFALLVMTVFTAAI